MTTPTLDPSSTDPATREAVDLLVALGDTSLVARAWEPDGTGVVQDGVIGGDGALAAVSVRYHNRFVPNAQITSYYYVVDTDVSGTAADEDDLPFIVEHAVEYFLGDRPPSEGDVREVWSGFQWTNRTDAYPTEALAQAVRDADAAADRASHHEWDGEPDPH